MIISSCYSSDKNLYLSWFIYLSLDNASGTFNELSRNSAIDRMVAAGAQPLTWFAVANEIRRDWLEDMEGYLDLFYQTVPAYAPLIDSYNALTKDSDK